ncbi:hypothetical protein ACJX0J_010917 [Zea mays]
MQILFCQGILANIFTKIFTVEEHVSVAYAYFFVCKFNNHFIYILICLKYWFIIRGGGEATTGHGFAVIFFRLSEIFLVLQQYLNIQIKFQDTLEEFYSNTDEIVHNLALKGIPPGLRTNILFQEAGCMHSETTSEQHSIVYD